MKEYNKPEAEVVMFETIDVVTTSTDAPIITTVTPGP